MREEPVKLSPVGITSKEADGFALECDNVVEPHEAVLAEPILAASTFRPRLLLTECTIGQRRIPAFGRESIQLFPPSLRQRFHE